MLQLRWDSARRCHTWLPPSQWRKENWRPKDVQRSHVSYVTSSFLVGFSVWCCMILYKHTLPPPIQPRTIQTWPSSSWRRSSNPWSTPLCTWTRLASKSPEQNISLMSQKYFFGSSSVYLCSIWHQCCLVCPQSHQPKAGRIKEPLKFLSQSTTRCKTPSALWTSFATPCPIVAAGLGRESSSFSPTIDRFDKFFFHQVAQKTKQETHCPRSCCEGSYVLLAKLAGLSISPCPCRIDSSWQWLLRHLFLRQADPIACSKSPKAVDMCPSVVTKDRQSAMLSKL